MTDKTITSVLDGKIIVVSSTESITVPLHCDLCEFPMRSVEDSIAFRKTGCCHYCDNRWGTPREGEDGWDIKNGRYPLKDTEEWKSFIELKALSHRPLFIFK